MFKDSGTLELKKNNVEKYAFKEIDGKPSEVKNYFRKKTGFFPAPEIFDGEHQAKMLNIMRENAYKEDNNFDITAFKLKSTDGNLLDSVEIVPKNKGEGAVYVLNLFGAVDAYEQNLPLMKSLSQRLGVVNVGFNVPGVGRSTGVMDTKDTAVKAGVAQVLRLVEKGVKPEKIILSGHSMGAAIAVLVAEHLHSKGLKVNVFHNRSFGNISKAYAAMVFEPAKNHESEKKNYFRIKPMKAAFGLLVTTVARSVNWDMDVNKSFNAVAPSFKDYIVIKPNKEDRKVMTGDEMVRSSESLHALQRVKRRKVKDSIKKAITFMDSVSDIKKVPEIIKDVAKNYSGTIESNKLINKILQELDEDKSGKRGELKVSGVKEDLINLYSLVKYERKFLVNLEKLIKDVDNTEVVRNKYFERCDRFLIPRDGDVAQNIKTIGKYEAYYAQWMEIGLLKKDILSHDEKVKRITRLANNADVHAIPLEYIIQRKEKPFEKLTGLQYFDNFINARNVGNISKSREMYAK